MVLGTGSGQAHAGADRPQPLPLAHAPGRGSPGGGGTGRPQQELTKPPMKRAYLLGAFSSSDGAAGAWRTWVSWQSDIRPWKYATPGQNPDVLDADPRDVESLNADLENPQLSASDFDLRHRHRVAAIWVAEAPAQEDIIRA